MTNGEQLTFNFECRLNKGSSTSNNESGKVHICVKTLIYISSNRRDKNLNGKGDLELLLMSGHTK